MTPPSPSLTKPPNKGTFDYEHISPSLESGVKGPKVPGVYAPNSAPDKGLATVTANRFVKKSTVVSSLYIFKNNYSLSRGRPRVFWWEWW